MGLFNFCVKGDKYSLNDGCCASFGGWFCGGQQSAVPANPAPPAPITPPTATDTISLVFTQSAYGGAIPIIFGSDLISGNVIWASPFVKKTYTDGGQQKFYYSVNLAIAVCEGVLDKLLRLYCGDVLALDNTMTIDENGNPIPNDNGQVSTLTADLVSETSPLVVLDPTARKTKITIFDGSPDQTPPEIMQLQEGYEYTPAYRGVAYLLLENFLIADSIPSLTMEVSANTVSLYPRQENLYAGNAVLTTTPLLKREFWSGYLKGYDVVMSIGASNDYSSLGMVVTDNNSFTLEKESVFVDEDTGLSFDIHGGQCMMLPTGNVLLKIAEVAGVGHWAVYSPFYNSIASETGLATSSGNHTSAGPGDSFGGNTIVRGVDDDGTVCDLAFIVSLNACIAILAIYEDGSYDYPFYSNAAEYRVSSNTGVLSSAGYCKAVPFFVPDETWVKQKTFPDGGSTRGPHIYYFNVQGTDGGAHTTLYVDRLEYANIFDGSVSLAAPRLTQAVDTISYDDLHGSGQFLSIAHAFPCPSDNTIIVCCNTGNSSGLIFKYDPLNARIVWKTLINHGFITPPGSWNEDPSAQDVSNDKFAWIANDAEIVISVDLTDGTVTEEFTLASQNLPARGAIDGKSQYRGKEDALIYQSLNNGLVKVFLSRANRAQVALTTIVKSLLQRVDWREADTEIQGIDTLAVDGYTIASSGYTLRQAFSELQQVFTFDIIESNGSIVYKQRGGNPIVSFAETKMMFGAGSSQPWLQETHEYDITGTRKISVTYRDVDREYKSSVQTVHLPKYSNTDIDADSAISVQVPIVLDADTARKLAEILLYAKITYQTGYDGTLPQSAMPYDPSDVVTFSFNPVDDVDDVTMRLRQMSIGADWSIKINGTREDPEIYQDQVNLFGTLGRYTPQQIPQPPARVDFKLLEVPFWSEAQAITQDNVLGYPVYLALTSLRKNATFPKDNITLTTTAGTTADFPAISAFPTWGFVIGNIGSHKESYTTQFDKKIQVQMQSTSGALLGNCTDYYDMVSNRTKNLAMIGDELIQFQNATDLGNGLWELSVITRCLFGTEDGADRHKVGDQFFLLYGSDGLPDVRGYTQVTIPLEDGPDKFVKVAMPNSKNQDQTAAEIEYTALQYRPWKPAAGKINQVSGDLVITWERRARYNGQWPDDGSEAGLPPFTDGNTLVATPGFDLYLTTTPQTFNPNDASTFLRKVEVPNAETFTYTAAMQAEDGYTPTTVLTAVVMQTVAKTGLDESLGLSFSWGLTG